MTFADPTGLVVAYLAPQLGPLVAGRVPTSRPSEFVQVRRSGGLPRPPVREVARMDVTVWAATDPRAVELANQARVLMWALAGTTLLDPGVPVYEVAEFVGPTSVDDDLTETPRMLATYDLTIRADDVIHTAPTISP